MPDGQNVSNDDVLNFFMNRLLRPNLPQQSIPQQAPVPSTPSMPNVSKYLELAQQTPTLEQHKPSWLRRLGSIPIGAEYGPQAQEQYLNIPYAKAYQDWAQKLKGLETAAIVPSELGLKGAQTYEALQKARESAESAKLYGFQQTPEYYRLTKGWLPGTEKEKLEELAAQHPIHPYNLQQEEVRLQEILSDPTTSPEMKETAQQEFDALQSIKTTKPSALEERIDINLKAKGLTRTNEKGLKSATPQDINKAMEEVTPTPSVVGAGVEYGRTQTTADRVNARLDKRWDDMEDYNSRLSRLTMSLNMRNVAIDPVVGPEFLSAMVGKGVGLRMNEAEIARIFGGLQGWDLVQRNVNRWLLGDHTTPYLVPDEMRNAFKQAAMTVLNRSRAEQKLVEGYQERIANAKDPMTIRRLNVQLKKEIDKLDQQDFTPKQVVKPGELVP